MGNIKSGLDSLGLGILADTFLKADGPKNANGHMLIVNLPGTNMVYAATPPASKFNLTRPKGEFIALDETTPQHVPRFGIYGLTPSGIISYHSAISTEVRTVLENLVRNDPAMAERLKNEKNSPIGALLNNADYDQHYGQIKVTRLPFEKLKEAMDDLAKHYQNGIPENIASSDLLNAMAIAPHLKQYQQDLIAKLNENPATIPNQSQIIKYLSGEEYMPSSSFAKTAKATP